MPKQAKDARLAAYLKNPNYTQLAAEFEMSPMGFRGAVLRAAEREGVDLAEVQRAAKADKAANKAKTPTTKAKPTAKAKAKPKAKAKAKPKGKKAATKRSKKAAAAPTPPAQG